MPSRRRSATPSAKSDASSCSDSGDAYSDNDFSEAENRSAKPQSKRRKTTARVADSAPRKPRLDNSLYDSLIDADIPLEDVVGGTARMLEYDPNDGLLEVLNLVVKAAGCGTSAQLTAPAAAARDLESLAAEYAPAKYPLVSDRDFGRRYAEFFAAIVPELAQAEMLSAFVKVEQYVREFAVLKLRSVRHAASVALFSGASTLVDVSNELQTALDRRTRHTAEMQAQVDQAAKLHDLIQQAAVERSKDIFAPIRECAATALGALDPSQLGGRLLNDEAAVVRLAALKHAAPRNTTQWKRVLEIADRDVDTRCRRQALRLLADAPPAVATKGLKLIFDAEPTVRAAAATLAVQLAPEPEPQFAQYKLDPQWRLILWLEKLEPNALVAATLTKAGKLTFRSITGLILQDFSRLKAQRSDADWVQQIAEETSNATHLVAMALGAGRHEWDDLQRRNGASDEKLEKCGDFVSVVLEVVPRLLSKFAPEADRLADAISLLQLADLGAVVRRGLEPAYEEVFEQVLQSLAEQSTAQIAASVQLVLSQALASDSPVSAVCSAAAQQFYDEQRGRDSPNLLAIAALAPHVDISDMANATWTPGAHGEIELATALGTFYPEAAARAAECLTAAKAAEQLLRVYTIASVRQTPLPELPDISFDHVSTRTLEAAKAARVL